MEALDRTMGRTGFGRGCGPVVRQVIVGGGGGGGGGSGGVVVVVEG